jgi:hypothetical protein
MLGAVSWFVCYQALSFIDSLIHEELLETTSKCSNSAGPRVVGACVDSSKAGLGMIGLHPNALKNPGTTTKAISKFLQQVSFYAFIGIFVYT